MKQLTGTACLQMERVSQGQSDWILQRLFLEERWREAPTPIVDSIAQYKQRLIFTPITKKALTSWNASGRRMPQRKPLEDFEVDSIIILSPFQGQHYTRAHWKKTEITQGTLTLILTSIPQGQELPLTQRTPQASSMNGKNKYLLPLGIGC